MIYGGGGLLFEGLLEKVDRSILSAFFVPFGGPFIGFGAGGINGRYKAVMSLSSPP